MEKCDVSTGNWERVPLTATGTTCPVRGLVEGKRYKFRVSAVNMMGASEPIETSVPITAKNPFGKNKQQLRIPLIVMNSSEISFICLPTYGIPRDSDFGDVTRIHYMIYNLIADKFY